jgi:hypothetical protein
VQRRWATRSISRRRGQDLPTADRYEDGVLAQLDG